MTQDEIIEMAREAGGVVMTPYDYGAKPDTMILLYKELEAFAKLVAAKEREACAKILDANAMACNTPIMRSLLQANATAIRARGQA